MEKPIIFEIKDSIAFITLNRPEKANSLSRMLVDSLNKTVKSLACNSDVRVVVITGGGDKAFCAGADLKERETFTEADVTEFLLKLRETFLLIENLPQPVIAVINGVALGGGTELALACDIRIASENAVLGLTEVKLGIIPGAGGTQRLPRIIGKGKAKEMILLGKRVDAYEAEKIGLVNFVAKSSELTNKIEELTNALKENAPVAMRQVKYAINKGCDTGIEQALDIELKAYDVCIPTQDRLEGLKAFREKRKPVYKGK